MEKSKKLSIFPSSVVISKHYDNFTKKITCHPFVVWKRQGFDSKLKNNVYAFRLTTQTNNYDDYKVPVKPSSKNGLKDFSFICVDSIFLLSIEECELIGQLDSVTFLEVIEARNKQHSVENEEAFHTLKNMVQYEMK